jgi:hypothetical protein
MAVAVAIIAFILFPLSKVLAEEEQVIKTDGELDRFVGQPRVHLANDTLVLHTGVEKAVNFTTSITTTDAYIVGNATVDGGGVWIKVTNTGGQCPGMEACSSVAVYSKDAPWSYYNGDMKDVEIPIPKGMTQVVFYTPYENGSTITFNFDIVRLVDSKSSSA